MTAWIYPALKWMHIVAAALVVGALLALLRVRADATPDAQARRQLLDATRWIVERMLLAALGVLFVTGLLLSGGPFPGPDDVDRQGVWVVLGMAAWAALVAVGGGYLSLLARQTSQAQPEAASALSRHYRRSVLAALSLAIVAVLIMVLKPSWEA